MLSWTYWLNYWCRMQIQCCAFRVLLVRSVLTGTSHDSTNIAIIIQNFTNILHSCSCRPLDAAALFWALHLVGNGQNYGPNYRGNQNAHIKFHNLFKHKSIWTTMKSRKMYRKMYKKRTSSTWIRKNNTKSIPKTHVCTQAHTNTEKML